MSSGKSETVFVRLTLAEAHRLQGLVEAMMMANPALEPDDCIDAVFALGLASTTQSLELMAQFVEHRP